MNDTALRTVIVDLIRHHGPMPFERFMGLALYHPELGYYTSGRARQGKRGDYVTSPTLSPVFGQLIARQLAEMWAALGRPGEFWVVEFGAGARPYLAEDVLAWTSEANPPFAQAIRYTVVEAAAPGEGERPGLLRVRHADELARKPFVGCVLSNEFVDSLPVARVKRAAGEWLGICVKCSGEGVALSEALRPLSSEALAQEVSSLPLPDVEGYTTEVHLASARWIAQAGQLLERGFVLTIDYGYPEAAYYAPERPDGTLRCYYRHTMSNQPLERIGLQDMTAHVNFSGLVRHGRSTGLEPCGRTDQTNFLLGVGEAELSRWIASRSPHARSALALLHPENMGAAFQVLIQHKNAPGIPLSGLSRRVFR